MKERSYTLALREVWDWLKCHTVTRYHLLDLRDRGEGHGYRWGFEDRGFLMLIACFTLLRDFVELEDPEVGLRSEELGDPYRARGDEVLAHEREIRRLYTWWMKERAEEHDEVDALLGDEDIVKLTKISDHPNYEEWMRRSRELDAKDDAQLLRLIRLRGRLWT